jgi:YggT family protein
MTTGRLAATGKKTMITPVNHFCCYDHYGLAQWLLLLLLLLVGRSCDATTAAFATTGHRLVRYHHHTIGVRPPSSSRLDAVFLDTIHTLLYETSTAESWSHQQQQQQQLTAAAQQLLLLSSAAPSSSSSSYAAVILPIAATALDIALNAFSLAMLARVVLSWYPGTAKDKMNPWIMAVVVPTEPLLRAAKGFIPPAFGVDITPVFWLALFTFCHEILLGPQGLIIMTIKYGTTM